MGKVLTGNSDWMKQLNRSTVLNVLRHNGPISKVDIADQTSLTFATISNIISELLASQLIFESGYGKSSGGRKPILYELNLDNVFVIGVVLGVSHIRSAVVNIGGKIVADYSTETIAAYENGINQLFHSIDEVIKISNVDRNKIAGIGISSPGPVNSETGMILTPPNLQGWRNVPIKELVSQRYDLITLLEKDANAAALGEQWFGSAQGKENVLYVLADQGIGGGVIIQGQIYRGFKSGAGEIGHGSIDIDGPRCNCGSYGCLEAMASGIAIVRRAKEEIHRGSDSTLEAIYQNENGDLTIEHIITEALTGDPLANSILREAGRYLGIGVANLINFFKPEEIILGGSIVNKYPLILNTVKDVSKKRTFSNFAETTSIKASALKEHADIVGASTLVMQYLFNSPETIMP